MGFNSGFKGLKRPFSENRTVYKTIKKKHCTFCQATDDNITQHMSFATG
jgi:hypothetical protein